MFTRIIEDLGTIVNVDKKNVTASTNLSDINIGDSVSVNGVCLTAVKIQKLSKNKYHDTIEKNRWCHPEQSEGSQVSSNNEILLPMNRHQNDKIKVFKQSHQITFDVSEETFSKTNLGKLKIKNKVNLERALKTGGRFGGHFVNGHVEGIGKILSVKRLANSEVWEFSNPGDLSRYIVEKGSIAVDGISLTVTERKVGSFKVSLIPHTLNNTTLSFKKTGDTVNLETDVISKYVFQNTERRGITMEKLRKAGYL